MARGTAPPEDGTEEGFTLIELMLSMGIFAVIGASLVGMIMIWFSTSQGTSTSAISSTDSQNLAGYFAADVASTTLPSFLTQTTCASSADFQFTWTAAGNTYLADYKVVGSTLRRTFSVNGVAGTPLTLVHYLQTVTPVCLFSLGTTRTMTVDTVVPGLVGITPAPVNSTFSVTGYGRGAGITALLGQYPPYINATTPIVLYGTYTDRLPNSSITNVSYSYCHGLSCLPSSTIASFSSPYGGTNEGTSANPAYSLDLNFGSSAEVPTGTPPDGPYSLEAIVTYSTNGTPPTATLTSNIDTGALDTFAPAVTLTAPANTSVTQRLDADLQRRRRAP